MPELPEVEEAVVRLRAAVAGRMILAAITHHPSQRRQFPPRHAGIVSGQRLVAVLRRGKHQLLQLSSGATLHVHFRLGGDWEFSRSKSELPRHARFSLEFTNGARASLTDPRALVTVRYYAPDAAPTLDLGPEADDPALTVLAFRDALSARRGAIKPVLLDQRVIAGVGNIYASEALWRAQLHPAIAASTFGAVRAARLLESIRSALADGVCNAATYRTGVRVVPFDVYDREGEPCNRCGSLIRRLVQAARSTYFCAGCQRR